MKFKDIFSKVILSNYFRDGSKNQNDGGYPSIKADEEPEYGSDMLLEKKIIVKLLTCVALLIVVTTTLLAFVAFIIGIGIVFVQSLTWLKTGVWEARPLITIVPYSIAKEVLELDMIGLRKILIWLLENFPGSLFLMILSIPIFFFGWSLFNSCTESASRLEDKWDIDWD
jgi:hypothetical protein